MTVRDYKAKQAYAYKAQSRTTLKRGTDICDDISYSDSLRGRGLQAILDNPKSGHVAMVPSREMTVETYMQKLNSIPWLPISKKEKP